MMKRLIAIFLSIAVLLGTVSLGFAASDSSDTPSEENYVANELIITRAKNAGRTAALPLEKAEIIETDALEAGDETVIKGTVKYGTDIEALCEKLEQREDILRADPNYLQKVDEIEIPDEARHTGSDFNAFNWYRDSLHLTEAWRTADTLGSEDVVVAVIDTGVNTAHKDLQGAMWTDENGHYGYNAVAQNYDVSDTYGHGSNVAGIIAMRANDYGYVGIAPQVKIMACKAATSVYLSDSDILTCLNYAVEHEADIINMSFGSKTLSSTMAVAYQRASTKAILIAAAGNDGNDAAVTPQYPAACGGVTGVMAYGSNKNSDLTNYTIDNGTLADFSNYDKTGKYYQIAAPGVEIAGPAPNDSTTGFTFKTGTSQAAPIVAGAAAIYLSLHPGATPYQVRCALVNSSNETVAGYGDKYTQYKKINLAGMWSTAPCADEEVPLSEEAKSILCDSLDVSLDTVHRSDMQALSLIPYAVIKEHRAHIQALAELNTAQFLELFSLQLTNEDMAWLADASFSRLYELRIGNNPQLSTLQFGEATAPALRFLNADKCALTRIEGLEYLPMLYSLSLAGNHFECSFAFEHLKDVSQLILSDCGLQDVAYFPQLRSLVYLDVSENYISDIYALRNFKGYYLDVSYNPLHMGESQGELLRTIQKGMQDNRYHYDEITFSHLHENGKSDVEYIQAKTIQAANIQCARSAQRVCLPVQVLPENANVGASWSLQVQDKDITFHTDTKELSWDVNDITASRQVECMVDPYAGFACFPLYVQIAAPEICDYYTTAQSGNYLIANIATEYVKIDGSVYDTYIQRENVRIFDLSRLPASHSNLPATAYDAYGAGNTVAPTAVENVPPENSGAESACIERFTCEHDTYYTGETTVIRAYANNATEYVKFYNYHTKQSLILHNYIQQDTTRIFTIRYPITAKGSYYWKAYASATTDFAGAHASVRFHAEQGVSSISLSSDSGSQMYLDGQPLQLHAQFEPENAAGGKTLHYTSSDTDIATVSADGKVIAQNYGSAVITAENETGIQAHFAVFVLQPQMSEPETADARYPEPATVTLHTKGCNQIVLKNDDGSDIAASYESSYTASDQEGYDRAWTIRVTPTGTEPLSCILYAADESGIHTRTPHKTVRITPLIALTDFAFTQEQYSFSRCEKNATIRLITQPAQYSAVNWEVSDSSVAAITAQGDSCVLRAKKAGSVTLTATAAIDGENVSKSVPVVFEAGKILSMGLETTTIACYEPVNVFVTTDQSITTVKVTDATNSLSETYPASGFAVDSGTTRIWTMPFSFKRNSTSIKVTAQDALGDCQSRTSKVSATLPDSGFAANPGFVSGVVSGNLSFNLITLPSRANISNLRYTAQIEDESIATFSVGTVRFLKEGETTMHCTYGDVTKDVTIHCYANIQSIRLSGNARILGVGETFALEPITTPASAQPLRYESDREDIVGVSASGVMTARSPGTATITVTALSGASATMKVTVSNQAASDTLRFDKASYEVGVGETVDCMIMASEPVTCISSNEKIITVDSEGNFVALKEGTATIYAISDSTHIASAKVRVYANRQLSLSKENLTMNTQNFELLFAFLSPATADLDGAWYSDNEAVATVDQNGIVYAKSGGTCHVLFISDRGETATCTVQVISPELTALHFYGSELQMKVNEHQFVLCSTDPADALGEVVWESEDENIATVDSNGIVYACGAGRTMINAYLPNDVAYGIYVNVSADMVTLSGKINAPNTTMYLIGAAGKTSQKYDVSGAFTVPDINSGSYTVRLTAPHHTGVYIYEADLYHDTDLGDYRLYNGDANRDGIVGIADISLLLKSTNYGASAKVSRKNCDMNDDEVIDIQDIEIILLAENYGGTDETITF